MLPLLLQMEGWEDGGGGATAVDDDEAPSLEHRQCWMVEVSGRGPSLSRYYTVLQGTGAIRGCA